jgi:hypothetical protein
MERLKSQNEAIKSGLDQRALAMRNKSLVSLSDGISAEMGKQYADLNLRLEKMKLTVFKNIHKNTFLECLEYITADICEALNFD